VAPQACELGKGGFSKELDSMRKVKVGYQLDFRNPPASGRSFEALYAAMLSQAQACEAMGFDSVWLTEHHFTDDGYLPAILPAASAIAARTKRVAIGTYVLLAPFQHPVKLAEDVAFIDVISGGRFRLGLGLGYRDEEFRGFGIARNERMGRTLETIEILKRAWTGERFDFDGRYFHLRGVRVLPTPVSKPHPELLWGAGAPKAIARAAKLGLSFACVGGRREITVYLDALRAAGLDPARYSIVNSRVVYVADSEETAWRDTRDALVYQAELYEQWLKAAQALGAHQGKVLLRPDLERLRRSSILGPPERVRTAIAEILESTPMTDLLVVMQLPGLDPGKARRSLERFAAEVLPEINGAKPGAVSQGEI
jgi:alkanesulfonate monooxygenase SsuD/methylene tetrahydromethanopterin reductase-like flavin-dependent oxidoreductase (luciferase family)